MNIRETLLEDHTKTLMQEIAEYIGDDSQRFAELVEVVVSRDKVAAQRAAWALSKVADRHPALLRGHLRELLAAAQDPPHVAVRRNIIRVLQFVDIPDRLEGEIYTYCFELASSTKEDIGVRAHALSVIGRIAQAYPELRTEIKELMRDMLSSESAGIQARIRNISKQLKINVHD